MHHRGARRPVVRADDRTAAAQHAAERFHRPLDGSRLLHVQRRPLRVRERVDGRQRQMRQLVRRHGLRTVRVFLFAYVSISLFAPSPSRVFVPLLSLPVPRPPVHRRPYGGLPAACGSADTSCWTRTALRKLRRVCAAPSPNRLSRNRSAPPDKTDGRKSSSLLR